MHCAAKYSSHTIFIYINQGDNKKWFSKYASHIFLLQLLFDFLYMDLQGGYHVS